MQQIQFRALGGLCQIDLISQSGDCPIVQLVKNEVDRIEKKYSRFIPNSVVGMINHNAGSEWVECDEETLGLIQYAFHLYEISNGLFDITSGVLRSVWNFQEAKIPSSDSIKKILPLIGLNYLERNGSKVKLAKKGMQIDLGGLGKEYAADRAALVLRQNGVQTIAMMTGDRRPVALRIGAELGIRPDEIHADLLPADKVDLVAQLAAGGKLAFVGDGVNDAAALARADVGIAMGVAGSEVALQAADVAFLAEDMGRLADAHRLSRRAARIIRQNLIFAMSAMAVLVVGALAFELPLPLAVIGHEGGTLLVVLNGLRLLNDPIRRGRNPA